MTHHPDAVAPRLVRKRDAVTIVGSRKLVERMLHASQPTSAEPWLKVVPPRPGTKRRDVLIEVASVHAAVNRLLTGDHPPVFPSEEKPRQSRPPKPRKKRRKGERPSPTNEPSLPLFPEETQPSTHEGRGQ